MTRKTSISLDENSYLFLVKHGKRNKYIDRLIEENLINMSTALLSLRKQYKDHEIIALIKDIGMPAGRWEKIRSAIPEEHKLHLAILWEEISITGIDIGMLINELDKIIYD